MKVLGEINPLPSDSFQTLTEHLIELRKSIIRSLLIVLVGFAICFTFSDKLFSILRQPILPFLRQANGVVTGLVFTSVTEKFMTHVKMSFVAGIVLTAPLWLFQVWNFIAPGLYKHERRYAMSFIFSGTALFLLGASFAYFLALPSAYKFLLSFGGNEDQAMISISEHLSFLNTIILLFGFVFEMPLVLLFLGFMGIIDSNFLKKHRRYAIVIIAIVAAIFSPPDLMSMILVLVPMIALYELSVLLLRWLVKPLDANGPKPTKA